MPSMSATGLGVAALLMAAVPAQAQSFALPKGPGKQIVENTCGACHPLSRLGAGYTPEGWRSVVHMMQNMEAPVSPDQWPVVTEYLIESFPEKPKPAAVILEGSVHATLREWPVPTPGSRPHDADCSMLLLC